MEKLYLMRHARFHIYGPLRPNEIKSFLSSQKAPLSHWEICGHLGQWTTIENEEGMKAEYSELWDLLNSKSQSFSWKNLFSKKK